MSSNISVVIPVYNEADKLEGCLEALANQSISPMEVIVVDNNSEFNYLPLINKYPFLRILKEKKQGVVFARFKGFNAAIGDVIATADADTRVRKNWVSELSRVFESKGVDAVSGYVYYYDVVFAKLLNPADKLTRRFIYDRIKNTSVMQGSNMAVRKTAWNRVKSKLCLNNDYQDDSDLAIHLHEIGSKVTYDKKLMANVSVSRTRTGFIKTFKYFNHLPKTYKSHNKGQAYLFYLALFVIMVMFWPARLAHWLYRIK